MKKRGDGWYLEGGRWRKRYWDADGARPEFQGYSDKTLSKKAYERKLDEVEYIKHCRLIGKAITDTRDIFIIAEEYISWGRFGGGNDGGPWAPKWLQNVIRYLLGTPKIEGLLKRMKVHRLDAITLHRFELVIVQWKNPRSRAIIGGILKAFLNWCKARKMLTENPLQDWPGKKMVGDGKRRAPTMEEFELIYAAAPRSRQMGYDFAYYGGARASEFEKIYVEMIRWKKNGIAIKGKKTKAGKEHFFRLPADYMADLKDYVRLKHPKALVFDLSRNHKDRYFHKDREAAGIPYKTEEGVLTFHSLRHLFETILGYAASDSATELEMGRHTDMRTRRIYLHAQEEAMQATVEAMAALRKSRPGDMPRNQDGVK